MIFQGDTLAPVSDGDDDARSDRLLSEEEEDFNDDEWLLVGVRSDQRGLPDGDSLPRENASTNESLDGGDASDPLAQALPAEGITKYVYDGLGMSEP